MRIRYRFGPVAIAFGLGLAVAMGGVSLAQPRPPRVVQTADGTLYLIVPEGRLWLIPQPITDEELLVLPDIGAIIGELPQPAPPPAPPAAPAPPLPPPPPAPVAPEEPVTVSGERTMSTRPFMLRGGNYTARWTARPMSPSPSCFHSATLRPVTPGGRFLSGTLGSGSVQGAEPVSGETQVYNVPADSYYVDALSMCAWSVTIRPLT
jgi:hypothetical protein